MSWSWYVVGAAFLGVAACSFFFALAESALFALGKWRAQQLADSSQPEGARLAALFQSPQDLLATLVLGNTFANGTLIGLSAWVLVTGGRVQWFPVLLLFLFLLLGCEVIPKILGVRAPEFWALRLAAPLQTTVWLMRPLRAIAQTLNNAVLRIFIPKSIKQYPEISEEEYPELLEIAHKQGALATTEKEIILQILSLDQATAREVMKPRSQIACISDDLSHEEMLAQARKIKHTRIPVYDETPDTIVGVINARALLLNPDAQLEEVMEFPSFVPETMNLLQLLKSLQRQRRGLAIVLDEFGGTAGLVTMEDILEHMLGRFGRRDGEPVLERLSPGKWRVSGACLVDEFRREYPPLGDVDEVDTMAGLLLKQMEYVPTQGESTVFRGLRLTAQQVDERRVHELLVETQKR